MSSSSELSLREPRSSDRTSGGALGRELAWVARILLADGVESSAAATGIPLHLALRIACAMCFVGHGAWGVITKAGWLPFYGVFGIPSAIAEAPLFLHDMGAIEIAAGLAAFA
jgi:hypothetical protein